MGLPPSEIRGMSLWQYQACIDGWNRAQGGGKDRLTKAQQDELWAWQMEDDQG